MSPVPLVDKCIHYTASSRNHTKSDRFPALAKASNPCHHGQWMLNEDRDNILVHKEFGGVKHDSVHVNTVLWQYIRTMYETKLITNNNFMSTSLQFYPSNQLHNCFFFDKTYCGHVTMIGRQIGVPHYRSRKYHFSVL